ncbi:MAG: hypothetical protein HGB20_08670 [Chlorobiaceae bacterium]|nr:hypothetical protein [Chlorobiaceae bacterium]
MITGDAKKYDGLSEDLAEKLAIGVPEARHLLCAFSRGMAGELLATGNVFLGGVGSFSVAYVPSEKKTGASGIIYTSPRNRLVFDQRVTGRDDSRRIVLSGVTLGVGEAERFRKVFLSVLAAAVKQKKEIRLKGFGTFAHDDGNYTFFPERSFDELLNREYLNLDEIVLPLRDASLNGTAVIRGRKDLRPFMIAAVFLIAAILAGVFYMATGPELLQQSTSYKTMEKVVEVPAPAETVSKPVTGAAKGPSGARVETAMPESLVLGKGDYTIVLATFHKRETASGQAVFFRTGGVPVFVWPTKTGESQYFRLATGKFPTASAASENLSKMPPEVVDGQARIQKVTKEIVLHGEKEL